MSAALVDLQPARRRPRTLEPLDTCPVELLEVYVGDCSQCRRAMARRGPYRLDPARYQRWFISARGRRCATCAKREDPSSRPGHLFPSGAVRRGCLQRRALAQLRAAVACRSCGGALRTTRGLDPWYDHQPDCQVAWRDASDAFTEAG